MGDNFVYDHYGLFYESEEEMCKVWGVDSSEYRDCKEAGCSTEVSLFKPIKVKCGMFEALFESVQDIANTANLDNIAQLNKVVYNRGLSYIQLILFLSSDMLGDNPNIDKVTFNYKDAEQILDEDYIADIMKLPIKYDGKLYASVKTLCGEKEIKISEVPKLLATA